MGQVPCFPNELLAIIHTAARRSIVRSFLSPLIGMGDQSLVKISKYAQTALLLWAHRTPDEPGLNPFRMVSPTVGAQSQRPSNASHRITPAQSPKRKKKRRQRQGLTLWGLKFHRLGTGRPSTRTKSPC